MPKVVTSISIDEDLWKTVRKYAIDKGVPVSELLEQSLQRFMANPPESQVESAAESVGRKRSEAARKAWQTRNAKKHRSGA